VPLAINLSVFSVLVVVFYSYQGELVRWIWEMDRRQWGFKAKWTLLKANRALTFGFGAAVALMLMIPLVGLLCAPTAAVGGTLLFCDLEQGGALLGLEGQQGSQRVAQAPEEARTQ
jgi:uncharacterized protein involved in cysteine biosynthesis